MSKRHEDRVCLVTGAASGIGKATALRLVTEGALVVGCDLRRPSDGPGQSPAHDTLHKAFQVCDVTSQDSVDRLVQGILESYGRVDVLANVAGITDGYLPVHDTDDGTWRSVMGVNLDGPFRLSRAVLPAMVARHDGVIVNVSSVAGLRGGTARAAYTVSKHALIGLTRLIAWMYAYEGVRCNAVLPGGTQTPIVGKLESKSALGLRRSTPVLKQGIRMGAPDEIAAAISWLSSAESGFVNGALMTADGGWAAG